MDDFISGLVALILAVMVLAIIGVGESIDRLNVKAESGSAGGSVRNVAPEIRGISFINTTVIVTCFDANGANDIVSCTINGVDLERTVGTFEKEGVYARGYVLYVGNGTGVIRVTDDDGLFDEWGA